MRLLVSILRQTGLAFCLLVTLAPPAWSQDEIVVRGSSRIDLAIERFAGGLGDGIRQDLSQILGETGAFNLSEIGPASFVVSGGENGHRISATLTSPRGQTVFRREYQQPNLRANVRHLADDIVTAITGRPGIASSLIVFVSGSGRNKEICVCDYEGGNVRQLTSDRTISVSPSISRRAGYVAYTSYKSGYPDVYTIDLGSGARQRIIHAPGTNGGAAVSPDGQRIALTMSFSGNKELYVTNRMGNRPRALTQTPWSESSPAWSPDGSEIAFSSDQQGSPRLYRMSASGGTPRPIPTGFSYATEPDWSPDGRRLAFSGRKQGRIVIAIHDFESGRTTELGAGEDPSWGPDSRHLVFTRAGALIRVHVDTGTSLRLAPHLGTITEPCWSHE